VPFEVIALGFSLAPESVAAYVIVFGAVDLLLPQAATNPRPSAVASVNVCFCIGLPLGSMGH
jgi:hypothetical protein